MCVSQLPSLLIKMFSLNMSVCHNACRNACQVVISYSNCPWAPWDGGLRKCNRGFGARGMQTICLGDRDRNKEGVKALGMC